MRALFVILLLTSSLSLTAADNMAEPFGTTKDISGHSQNGPAPYERAANAISTDLVTRYRDSNGNTNFASVFNALGSLTGFGCQMAIREGFIKPGSITADKAFVVVHTKDGGTFFFGDFLNTPLLAEGQISVWSLVAGAAQTSGAKELPNVQDIAAYNAKTLGTKDFGVPRVPEQYRSQELPMDVLKRDWLPMQKLLVTYKVDPKFWGWTFALAAQRLIISNKSNFDPGAAATIVMEAALPMSKIDPKIVGISPD